MTNQLIACACVLWLTSCSYQDSGKGHSRIFSKWKQGSTTHFRFYAQKGVRSENKLELIGEKAERIQQKLLGILKENEKQKLDIFLLKDRETLTSYTGFPANGYTNTQKGIVYFVDQDPFHLALQHEIMHTLSWRRWRTPKGYWISEGLAVFAAGNCGGYNLHSLAHALDKEGKLIPFSKLIDSFDFKSLEPSLQSASIVQYIYDSYGVAVLKAFWQRGSGNAKEIVSLSAGELEHKWLIHIRQEKYKTRINWQAIKDRGCE